MPQSPIGGILEGFLTAQQLKRQREQDLADRAIQQARMQMEEREFGLRQEGLELDRDRESRLAEAAKALTEYRGDMSERGWANVGLRAEGNLLRQQGMADAMTRFNAETDRKRKDLLMQLAKEYRGEWYSPSAALDYAYQQMDVADRVLGTQNVTPEVNLSPDLRGGMRSFDPSELFVNPPVSQAQPPPTMQGLLDQTTIPVEPSPKATTSQSASVALQRQREAAANYKKAELEFKKQLWPEQVKNLKLRSDLTKERTKLTQAETKGQELLNKTFPGYRDAQIQNLRAQAGAAQGRLRTILQELEERRRTRAALPKDAPYYMVNGVIKPNPADPRSAQANLNSLRSTYAKAHKNYSDTISDIAKGRKELEELRSQAWAAKRNLDALVPGTPEHDEAIQGYLQVQGQGDALNKAVRELEGTAEAQLGVVNDLDKKIKAGNKAQGEALNRKPEAPTKKAPPKFPYRTNAQRAQARAEQDRRLQKPSKKPLTKKPISKMTDAELDAAIEAAKQKRR